MNTSATTSQWGAKPFESIAFELLILMLLRFHRFNFDIHHVFEKVTKIGGNILLDFAFTYNQDLPRFKWKISSNLFRLLKKNCV